MDEALRPHVQVIDDVKAKRLSLRPRVVKIRGGKRRKEEEEGGGGGRRYKEIEEVEEVDDKE